MPNPGVVEDRKIVVCWPVGVWQQEENGGMDSGFVGLLIKGIETQASHLLSLAIS
jgi:hypothetical protein